MPGSLSRTVVIEGVKFLIGDTAAEAIRIARGLESRGLDISKLDEIHLFQEGTKRRRGKFFSASVVLAALDKADTAGKQTL